MNGRKVLIVGGGGYVGAELQGHLLDEGFAVRVLDIFWYSDGLIDQSKVVGDHRVEYVKADIRDEKSLRSALVGISDCIHLACISNDPSYELDPALSRSVNFDAFRTFLRVANESQLKRLIYASSSSVYGVKEEPNVTEDLICEPRTDYSRFKVACEDMLFADCREDLEFSIIRPSTVCGVSRRQRFDLVVNILTINALSKGRIGVDGGDQYRPNLHIKDMVKAYSVLLNAPGNKINREVFNVAGENLKVIEIAELVRESLSGQVEIEVLPVVDDRSYRVSGEKILLTLGFAPQFTVRDAVKDIENAFLAGQFGDITDEKYFNLRTMKTLIGRGSLSADFPGNSTN
jgi:nucleoside-diphosphate-sugar epimerase